MDRLLVLARHGQSEWNLKNLFTGWRDPPLTEKGIEEAKHCGRELNKYGFIPDYCFTSSLQRAQHTLDLILNEGKIYDITITRNRALFADGAARAALWARDQRPGLYSMADVLGFNRQDN